MKTTEIQAIAREVHHDFSSLVKIMEILRDENGCPWDREQTHSSIRANMIEETYEVVEAIDTENPELLQEELGDVLLQVVFHSRIAEEENAFRIDDVIQGICEKLIHRHPHIFADVQASTSQEVLANWEKIKAEEKQRAGLSGSLAAIPPSLPALMRAQKSVKKCANAGMSVDCAALISHLSHASGNLSSAVQTEDRENTEKALADILFTGAAVAQNLSIDSEKILNERISRLRESVIQREDVSDSSDGQNAGNTEKWVQSAFLGESE